MSDTSRRLLSPDSSLVVMYLRSDPDFMSDAHTQDPMNTWRLSPSSHQTR